MDSFESYELTPINIREQIDLRERCTLVCIRKTDDGKTILIQGVKYHSLDQDKPTPGTVANVDAVLGLMLDIGIRREKQLTLSRGFYAPHDLEPAQSNRQVSQADFDEALFDQIVSSLNQHYQSGDPSKESAAINANYLIEAFNNARLLYPRFYNESYLGLMRIIGAISDSSGADEFSLASATISPTLNAEISEKISKIASLAERLRLGVDIFGCRLSSPNNKYAKKMANLDDSGRLVFACFYSAYRYRNKFVHEGFPFPDTVKHSWPPDSGMAYLNPVSGILHVRRYSPREMRSGVDSFDKYEVLGDPSTVALFKDQLFKLIPTWHFMKCLAKEYLLNHIKGIMESA